MNRYYDISNFDKYYGKSLSIDFNNFKLKDSHNQQVTETVFEGKYSLLTFGFTKCTGVCPVNMYRFKQLANDFGSKVQNLQFVFVSFDSDRDGVEELNSFLKNYSHENLIGLVDDETKGIDLAKSFIDQIYTRSKDKSKDYQIEHNGFIYLIGPNKKVELVYNQKQTNHALIAQDIMQIRKDHGYKNEL